MVIVHFLATLTVLLNDPFCIFMTINMVLQMLIVCLLAEVEKGRRSRWYPYLVQLPRSYNSLANFTRFEVQSFQVMFGKDVSQDTVWFIFCQALLAYEPFDKIIHLITRLKMLFGFLRRLLPWQSQSGKKLLA